MHQEIEIIVSDEMSREYGEPDPNDCRAMWLAVIECAIIDATWHPGKFKPRKRKDKKKVSKEKLQIREAARLKKVKESEDNRDDARVWLTTDSADLRTVASMAGVDPGYLLDRMRKLKLNGWVTDGQA